MKPYVNDKFFKIDKKACIRTITAIAVTAGLHIRVILPLSENSRAGFDDPFLTYRFTDIFVFISLFLVLSFVERNKKRPEKWTLILTGIFALTYTIASGYRDCYDAGFLMRDKIQVIISVYCFVCYLVLFYCGISFIDIFIDKLHTDTVIGGGETEKSDSYGHLWRNCFIIISVCWLFGGLLNYPGSHCPDSQSQLMQFFKDAEFTGHHPPLSTFIMGMMVSIGDVIGNRSFGYFLYNLFQVQLGAFIFSYGIDTMYRYLIKSGVRHRAVKWWLNGSVAFFAFVPFWWCFAQWFEKDLLYMECVTLFLLLMINAIVSKECGYERIVFLTLTGLISSLLRNNGIYSVVPGLIALGIAMKGKHKKRIFVSLASVLLMYFFITMYIYPDVLGIKSGSKAEALSIPFQQTARYVRDHGDEVTGYERDVIDGVLDYDALADAYNPILSDPVKATYKKDDSRLKEYFRVWGSMLIKHPGTYISSFLSGCFGYLAPVKADFGAEVSNTYESKYEYLYDNGIRNVFGGIGTKILISVRRLFMYFPLLRYLCMPGLYTWLLLSCFFILLKRRQYSGMVICVPLAVNVLVCMASPAANMLRYELPVAAAAPFLICFTLVMCSERKTFQYESVV